MPGDRDEKEDQPFIAAGADGGVGHFLAPNTEDCPCCGATPDKFEVRNYDPLWQDGDVVCTICETRVRGYDAS